MAGRNDRTRQEVLGLCTRLSEQARFSQRLQPQFGSPAVGANPQVLVVGDGLQAEQIIQELVRQQPVIVIGAPYSQPVAGVNYISGMQITRVEGTFGDFAVSLQGANGRSKVYAGGIVLALELSRVIDPNFALTEGQGVMPISRFSVELEQDWTGKTVAMVFGSTELASPKTIAEVLDCVLELNRKYATTVEIFYHDLPVAEIGLERRFRKAREQGFRFNRYAGSLQVHTNVLGITLKYADANLSSMEQKLLVDYLLCTEIFLPSHQSLELARILRIDLDEDGFFNLKNLKSLPGKTSREGIYCVEPGVQVKLIAGELLRLASPPIASVKFGENCNKRVLVIGAGLAGMVVAQELYEKGIEVILVEESKSIGGTALKHVCKATGDCQQCHTCRVMAIKSKLEGNPGIKIICNSRVKSIAGKEGNYKVTVHFLSGSRGLDLGAETTCDVHAIVWATGFDLLDPSLKSELGYGQHKGVITALELEEALQNQGSLRAAYGSNVRSIAFVQCVGSRDRSAGILHCSRVCCAYTRKLANLLAQEAEDIQVDVFYSELQSAAEFGNKSINSAASRVRYLRTSPAKVYGYPNDYLTVRFAENTQVREQSYDLLILAPAILPAKGLQQIAQEFGLRLNTDGFLAEQVVPGLYAAGSCTGPMNISETIVHAKVVASEIFKFVQQKIPCTTSN